MTLNLPALDPQGYAHSPGYRGLTFREEWAGTDRVMRGWDVFALQTGLNKYTKDPKIEEDGIFGPRTLTAVTRFQKNRDLVADGIAGGQTQLAIIRGILPDITKLYHLPQGGIKGAVENESGNWLGNHTERYANDSYDLGVIQINNIAKGVGYEQAFDALWALDFFGQTIRKAFDAYSTRSQARLARLQARGISDDYLSERRRWELAWGSWNRPAHTAWLAGETDSNSVRPTDTQLTWIEGYIDRVTVYITDWTV